MTAEVTEGTATRRSGPLVSIVTPTYNRAQLLAWTINSIRNQTYRNLEHIVMDGASTDGTADLLRRAAGTYPLEWHAEPDEGMYHAINAGLARSRGEILAYLNSDDLYFPWTIERVVQAFERHPEADFVFGDVLAADEATGRLNLYMFPPFHLDYLRRTGFLAQPGVFWRRKAFDAEGPFDTTLRYVADCDYWMRAGVRHRFVKVNEFLAIERNHPDTLREAVGSPLWAELDHVRSRYVTQHGLRHRVRVVLYRWRTKVWVRACYLAMGLQGLLPRRLRRGPWSRVMNSGHFGLSSHRLIFRSLPWLGRVKWLDRKFHGDVVAPSRFWLEPRGE
jgi:glycosyltransferase involved in cell wall biosynthesis